MRTLRADVGSLLVVGLESTSLSALERAWMRLVQPGGVILFRRNIAEAAQCRALLAEATELCAPHALRCVDVEGGTVDRLRDALAPTPSAQAVAIADRLRNPEVPTLAAEKSRKDGARESRGPERKDAPRGLLAYEHGALIGHGVKAFGFHVTLAPVLDLALPDSAGVMGSRTAGVSADEVTSFARAFLAGLAREGVAGCGKHFPGLGGGTRDSHFETPAIRRSWDDLWRDDVAPYRALARELPMVMVNHAAYPDTPGKNLPATASPFWITTVLRTRIGYRGLIFSDDMEMGGILKFMPMEEAAIAAIRAGMDTLEICHSPELMLRAYESLLREAKRSAAFRSLVQSRAREAARKRARIFTEPSLKTPTAKQLESLRTKILRFRERVMAVAGEALSTRARKHEPAPVETA
jgi:beta-N-acetylhexosaminidase